ncbi:MAG TPA: TspO/MBR family protein [Allosphingosinicella sp.]
MRGIASRSQLRMSYLRHALVTVPLVVLLGILSGRLAGSGYGNPWFDALEKPAFMPPGWLFGIAWTILYILLGLVLASILHARGARGRGLVLGLFIAQLLLNYCWSPLFFALHQTISALVVVLAMIGLSAAATVLLWRVRKPAALLMLPYLAWLGFAAALTFEVARLNPEAAELVQGGSSSDIIDETGDH